MLDTHAQRPRASDLTPGQRLARLPLFFASIETTRERTSAGMGARAARELMIGETAEKLKLLESCRKLMEILADGNGISGPSVKSRRHRNLLLQSFFSRNSSLCNSAVITYLGILCDFESPLSEARI